MATRTKSSGHAGRRPRVKGGQPRKYYPYVTAAQKKAGIAPMMGKFIDRQRANLETQGNRKGALDSKKRMSQSKAKPPLSRPWGATITKGSSFKNKREYMKRTGVGHKGVNAALKEAFKVSFGADPKSK